MAHGSFIDDYAGLAQYLVDASDLCFETTADRLNYGDIVLAATKDADAPEILGRLGVFAGWLDESTMKLRSYAVGARQSGEVSVDLIAANSLPYQPRLDAGATHEVTVVLEQKLLILDAKHDPDLAYNTWDLDRVAADLENNLAKSLTLIPVPDSEAFFEVKSKALLFMKDFTHGAGLILRDKGGVIYEPRTMAWRVGNPQRQKN